MTKFISTLILMALTSPSFAQNCIDMSGNFKAFSNSNKMTLVQKECESLEIQDPRGEFTNLILDGVRREIPNGQGNVTFAAAKFIDIDVIEVEWETFYNGSTTAIKLIRRLNYIQMTEKVFFVDSFMMIKPNGARSIVFEESWVKE